MMDSYRWVPRAIAEYYKALAVEREDPIPWARPAKPLSQSVVAAVTTAGIYVEGREPPFDTEREKKEPTWGDPTFRILERGVRQAQIGASHLHIDNEDILADFNIVLPIRRLEELKEEGFIGEVAPHHLSFMGFQMDNRAWRETYAPQAAKLLLDDGVDCVLLAPA